MVKVLNNKIRVLQRRAYGHRDDQYLGLKVVAAFLLPLPKAHRDLRCHLLNT